LKNLAMSRFFWDLAKFFKSLIFFLHIILSYAGHCNTNT
jgi:hypothetical protein